MSISKKLWEKCLTIIKDNVNEKAFQTWFLEIKPLRFENNEFTIQVPSQFFYEYIEETYADLIHATLSRVTGESIVLNYRVIVDHSNKKDGHMTLQGERKQSTNEERQVKGLNVAPDPLFVHHAQAWETNLNNRLSFNNYYEGQSNKLARTIGDTIASNVNSRDFNPFFVYGHSGVGKTHLCHAIGNKMLENDPDKKIVYISSHKFEAQFTQAVRDNKRNEFVAFYQGVDVLIIDDVQDLANKERTQNAFFNIFNHLHLIGKRLILTADKTPKDIEGLEERLTSRFNSGMIAELYKPDIELRRRILHSKIKQNGLNISDEIVEYIARNATDHVRDLEGIITSLLARSLVFNHEIDMNMTREIVEQAVKVEKKQITLERIQDVVSNYFNVNIDDIHSKSRKREIAQARQVAMYLSKKYTDHSYAHIGSVIGKRDHATVLHACKTVNNSIEVDRSFSSTMKAIEDLIQQ